MLLLLLAACGASAPDVPAGKPAPEFDLTRKTGRVVWRAIDQLGTASFTLASSSAPSFAGSYALNAGWARDGRKLGGRAVWKHPLPFPNDAKRPNYPIWGASLLKDGAPVPFVNHLEDIADVGWLIEEQSVLLLTDEDPSAWSLELRAPELAAAVARREWPGGEGDPSAFVDAEITAANTTTEAVHLPGGSSATFTVAVPPRATLSWGVATWEDPAGRGLDTAGAAVIRVDGVELDRAEARMDAPLAWRSADLAAYAGRTVRLELAAEGAPSAHVAFAAPAIRAQTDAPPRRVVVIGVDTLRQDALGVHGAAEDRTPELDTWAKQFVVFEHAYAPAPRTRPSFRTAFTGRQPLNALDAPTLAEHLRPLGFRTGGIVANVHLVPRFGFNAGMEHWYYENGAKAGDQVDRAASWLQSHADEDSFLFLHLMDPHTLYDAPAPYGEQFQTFARPQAVPPLFDRWMILNAMKKRGFDDRARTWVKNAYAGEVAYTSSQLHRLFTIIDALPGDSLVILHSDHGEELWDHDSFEHNHSVYDELVKVVLWVRPPGGWGGGPHRVTAPVMLADLVPTVLDLVGAAEAPTDGMSLRPYVDAAADERVDALTAALVDRPIPLGHMMFAEEHWGVVWKGQKYILHTASGDEEVYDLVADPRETKNLRPTLPAARVAELRAALSRATGWPGGNAWRILLKRKPRAFDLLLDRAVLGAGILDPELNRALRANLEWGEAPKLSVADLGSVTTTDPQRYRFDLKRRAKGQYVWVACDADGAGSCPGGRVSTEGRDALLVEGNVDVGGMILVNRKGWMLRPTVTEADVVAAARGGVPLASQLEALEHLGYVAPDEDE